MLIDYLGLKKKEVLFATYVGKATLPLRKQKLNAKTIHSQFYELYETYAINPDGTPVVVNGKFKKTYRFKLVDEIDPRIKLIVIDESGMVPEKMSEEIKTFGVPIIALGDHRQCKPIFGESELVRNPDVILDEIMRQKEGDPIIYLADMADRGEVIPYGKYGPRCFVVDEGIMRYSKIYTKPDMILCSTNKTRNKINDTVRYTIKRYSDEIPRVGEKMVCRKNNWNECIDEIPLINGLNGYVINSNYDTYNGQSMEIDFKPDCTKDWFNDIPIDCEYLSLDFEDKKKYNKMYPHGNLFEYGYASTVHLAQGSQCGYALLIDEPMGSDDFNNRVRYTGITRARHTLVIVRRQQKKFWYK